MRLIEAGCEYVLVTGTHENTPQVVNTLYAKSGVVRTDTWPRLPGTYHGSGCTLASAIAAMLANGLDLTDAVREAQDYTWHTLQKAYRPGMGQHLPDRLFWAREEADARGDACRGRACGRRARQPLSERARGDGTTASPRAGPGNCGALRDHARHRRHRAAGREGRSRHRRRRAGQSSIATRRRAIAAAQAGARCLRASATAAARSSSSTTTSSWPREVGAAGVHLGEDDGDVGRRAQSLRRSHADRRVLLQRSRARQAPRRRRRGLCRLRQLHRLADQARRAARRTRRCSAARSAARSRRRDRRHHGRQRARAGRGRRRRARRDQRRLRPRRPGGGHARGRRHRGLFRFRTDDGNS